MIPRLIGALKGDVATFEEVEHDEAATMQAAIVVVIAAVLGGIGAGLNTGILGGDDAPSFGGALITTIIGTLLGWLVWSAITHFIGSSLFGAQSSIGEMLRVIGFAHVALWLTVIPVVGGLAGLWFLWVAFKAVRAGLDISSGKTVLVILIGFVIRVILSILPGL